MILLREVKPTDLDKLYLLAERLNTLNLPADKERLERIIKISQDSFGGRYDSISDREYVFVMIEPDLDKIIGSCMIIAQHGTFTRPSVYYRVRQEQMYSSTIGRHFVHQVLQMTYDYDGPTEIGGLILDPEWRGHELKLGKLLSYVRFLYIGMHRDWFRDRVVAELLPPLREDGRSDLWDFVGANFTGLDYTEADKMSRENIEFVRSLFPSTPLYTCMLPPEVRAQIGQVGPSTKPVEKMLESIGFRYDFSIDPFDGGPTFKVNTADCEPIVRTERVSFLGMLDAREEVDGVGLIGFEYDEHEVRFRAAFVEYKRIPLQGGEHGVRVRGTRIEALQMSAHNSIGLLPLTGPDLSPLY
ncbi:MAG: arginine N-succinyltransferase [Myxococcota bacterium]|jgi:arginine N-succinyltransferase|nr:arginine N-succinyltransferase [Myxococcota bacterium]